MFGFGTFRPVDQLEIRSAAADWGLAEAPNSIASELEVITDRTIKA